MLEVLFGNMFWLDVEVSVVGDASNVLLAFLIVMCSRILIYYDKKIFRNQLLGVSGSDGDVIE